jgi:hypothetical protein
MKHALRIIPLALVAAFSLGACSRIPTGSVGIVKHFNGTISEQVAQPGMHMAILDSYYPIDTTLTRAEVRNMQPKDAHGVALRDVSVVVTYGLDPNKVAAFYRATKEMDPEPNSDYYTLGLEILEKSIIPYAVQIATEKSDLSTISSHLGGYASDIQAAVQQRLDKLYPGINPFLIQSVTVPTFDLPPAIQAQVNAKAGYQAELQTIAAEQAVVEQRKQLAQDKATVNANALAQAAKATGLTPDQIIAWEKARALSTMAQKMAGGQALVQVKP